MKPNDPALKRYYRSIRSWLPCSRRLKNQILSQIQDSVEQYLVQNPDASFSQLESQFGAPGTIAAAYVENTGTEGILRRLRIRRRITMIIVGVAAAILLAWASVVTWTVIRSNQVFEGQYQTTDTFEQMQ